MKAFQRIAVAAVATPLSFFGAFAQGVYIGPGGVGIDTGAQRPADRLVREYEDDDGCTVRVMRHYRRDGDVVTRREREC